MNHFEFTKEHVFYVALKNGHTFAYSGDTIVKLENNHIIVTQYGKFSAAFDLSEIAFATGTSVYYNPDTMTISLDHEDKPLKPEE